ncbi:MAG: hypothetical protein JSV86_15345 [Gemmatimonadota bacterium]|nr:MAG: hypothetical protein JSV86_15345 [Gemmatimonadota bacterium]
MSPASILHYRFPGSRRTLGVRLEAPGLLPLLASFYGNYRCPDPGGRVGCTISLEREDGSYRLVGPSGAWEAADEGEAVVYYESELTGALLEDATAFVHLHGAAVCDGSRCLLLVGPSGAGKSTLTLGLHLGGMRALADDALLIDPLTGEVHPFDRSIRVHEVSLRSLEVDPRKVSGARLCGPYLWLSPAKVGRDGAGSQRPAALVFLEAGQATSLERLSAAEVLRQLLLARLGDAPERDFECLARVAAEVSGYRLAYSDFREALDELARLRESR